MGFKYYTVQHKFCSCKLSAVWDNFWLFFEILVGKILVNPSKFCQNFPLPKFCVVQYSIFMSHVMSPQHLCDRHMYHESVHDGHVSKYLYAHV